MENTDKEKRINSRYIIIIVFIAIFTSILLIRLINIQIVNGDNYYEEKDNRLIAKRDIYAPRGNIFDANGIPIAQNRMGYYLQFVDTHLPDEQKNEMLLKLANILIKNEDSFNSQLRRYIAIEPIKFKQQNNERIIDNILVNKEDKELLKTAEDVFSYMRDNTFNIDKKYSIEDTYTIMQLRYEMLVNSYDCFKPLQIADDIDYKSVAEIEERNGEFEGFTVYTKPIRVYTDAEIVAHVLGYVRMIDSKQLEEFKEKWPNIEYNNNDIVGKNGIELYAEPYLKGVKGEKTVEVDLEGRVLNVLKEKPPVSGSDIYLTIDIELQKVAMESLKRNIEIIREKDVSKNFHDAYAGAAVAIDVNTGEVLAMVSYPSYNPDIFLKNDYDAINALYQANSHNPELNRTIQGTYAPGSTYKPLVAIAGLQEGSIKTKGTITCRGKIEYGGITFRCHGSGHGDLTIENALAVSCNVFFNELGVRTGIDNISRWAKEFGLGQKTGIDLMYERSGIISSKEYKLDTFNEGWWIADTAQSAIGQLYNQYTPLQLANYVSSIANGGKRYTPHLIKRIKSGDDSFVIDTPSDYYKIPVNSEYIDIVKKGMVAVTNEEDGTAVSTFRDFPFAVAGKTGTAETGYEDKSSSNALFVCYAPASNPKIAVAVVVENGVWGAYTAPIARDILKKYFNIENNNTLDFNNNTTINW